MHAPLFHKKPLDSSRPGYALADDVEAAIGDVTRHPLVTCVLNTVDDALDRSDAAGIAWGTNTVKHLAPLLDRARHAGRIVILTADHGHVIERRQSSQRQYPGISSGRSRPAVPPAGDGEILVTGRRVLLHDGTAVLAVDENLRYGPMKSGYHGGASPAEVVVPVTILVPGAVPAEAAEKLRLAPPQEPAWWLEPGHAQPEGRDGSPRIDGPCAICGARYPPPGDGTGSAQAAGRDDANPVRRTRRRRADQRAGRPSNPVAISGEGTASSADGRRDHIGAGPAIHGLHGAEEDRGPGIDHRRSGHRAADGTACRAGPPGSPLRQPRPRCRSRPCCCAVRCCTSSDCSMSRVTRCCASMRTARR